jgi:DHA3 family tetracycline resistance protein-like MFS transporter
MAQGDAIGQVLGGPAIGVIGTWWSLRAALLSSAALVTPGLLMLRLAGDRSAADHTVAPGTPRPSVSP